jgi:hypothetical protein
VGGETERSNPPPLFPLPPGEGKRYRWFGPTPSGPPPEVEGLDRPKDEGLLGSRARSPSAKRLGPILCREELFVKFEGGKGSLLDPHGVWQVAEQLLLMMSEETAT